MALSKGGKFNVIQLYVADCESIEPAGCVSEELTNVKGIDAIKEKGKKFNESVEEMHCGYTSEHIIAGNYFSLAMGMDDTIKRDGKN